MLTKSFTDFIGNTPIVELTAIKKEYGLSASVFAKIEGMNPAGSAKDRVALKMIEDAEARGILKPGGTIIEPTSGNTGIGLASCAVPKGYRVIIVMPDTMSMERRLLMTAYGAELVLTNGKLGMAGAIAEAERLQKEIEGSFIPDQFSNPANAMAHYEATGPEIWRDTEGNIDIFVAGVGTGGTVTGVGRYLKEKNPNIKIVAVEPKNSAVLSGGTAGSHGLQGIGAGFIPKVLDISVIDEIITVTDEEAYAAVGLIAKKEGIFAGISSGAALHAAIVLAGKNENIGKNIVALLPDRGDRYLSALKEV